LVGEGPFPEKARTSFCNPFFPFYPVYPTFQSLIFILRNALQVECYRFKPRPLPQEYSSSRDHSRATLPLNPAAWFLPDLLVIFAAPLFHLGLEQLYHLCQCPVSPDHLWAGDVSIFTKCRSSLQNLYSVSGVWQTNLNNYTFQHKPRE
jgi:hypothetical protein